MQLLINIYSVVNIVLTNNEDKKNRMNQFNKRQKCVCHLEKYRGQSYRVENCSEK